MVQLSVIIPCYNHSAYVARCVGSVLAQAGEEVEIILVDDGSTDGLTRVVGSLPRRVVFLQQPHRGPSAARNLGLQRATAQYATFLDADDVWLPGFMKTMLEAIAGAPREVCTVACGWQTIDIGDGPCGPPRLPDKCQLNLPNYVISNAFPVHAAVSRVDAVRAAGGFDESLLMEDWDLWMNLLLAGHQFSCVPAPLVGYRASEESLSRNARLMLANSIKVLDKVFANPSLPDEAQLRRGEAYAFRYLNASAGLYRDHEDDEAERLYSTGVELWPGLLRDRRALFALACARQPIPYKGTGEHLDLDDAELRAKRLLAQHKSKQPTEAAEGLRALYFVLAHLASLSGNGARARRYALMAARQDVTRAAAPALSAWLRSWKRRELPQG